MEINNILNKQELYLEKNAIPNIKNIKKLLINLKNNIIKNQDELYLAFLKSYNKCEFDVFMSEFNPVINEINWFIKNLNKIYATKKYYDPLWFAGHKTKAQRVGYGKVLIYAPYNYPFNLSLIPLIGAIAMNNTVTLKLSSSSYMINEVINKIIIQTFNKDQCYCLLGKENNIYEQLENGDFDLVFFTGSEKVGQKIYQNFAKKLIPVILELGGKCPVIIDNSANIKLAARRIIWAKMLNSGQTCVSPDYIICHEDIKNELITQLINQYEQQYPKNHPKTCITNIINKQAIYRHESMINNQNIIYKGHATESNTPFYIIDINNPNFDNDILNQEIFGPILPIITYTKNEQIKQYIKMNNYPLATYIFSNNKTFINELYYEIKTGGVLINDLILHLTKPCPFGGIKTSGIGQYHKQASVECFSQLKPIVFSSEYDINARYGPYDQDKLKTYKKLVK